MQIDQGVAAILITLVVQSAGAMYWAGRISTRVDHALEQIQVLSKKVDTHGR